MTTQADGDVWTPICALDKLPVERGVTALVRGHAVAVFLVPDGSVYVIGNHDPFSKSTVLGRGIVGVRDDIPFVASPSSRLAYDLRSGECLEDRTVSVPTYAVKVVDGIVHVGPRSHV
jgi:nitrite reductase (NADH) small subunit